MPITIGVLKEPDFDSRVSLLPEAVASLSQNAIIVQIESGAGSGAFATDADYTAAGGTVLSRDQVLAGSSLILSINPPLELPPAGKILLGVYQPLYNRQLMEQWASRGLISFSLDMLPRTTRAQTMDVLSSQANIAGYRAVLLAANHYPRYFPMLMTAAGSVPPAKILVLGAGVAGLQAIATARRLGAVVEVFDTRPSVKEEVMSLGAKFIEVEGAADASQAGGYAVEQSTEFQQRQKEKIGASVAKADIVITTAQIPGKKAPLLVTEEMIARMRRGSVIIDLAAASGGNTALTRNNETVVTDGVTIVGNSLLAAYMPSDASRLYSKNLLSFLRLLIYKDGELGLNFDDELVSGCCITKDGSIVHERIKNS